MVWTHSSLMINGVDLQPFDDRWCWLTSIWWQVVLTHSHLMINGVDSKPFDDNWHWFTTFWWETVLASKYLLINIDSHPLITDGVDSQPFDDRWCWLAAFLWWMVLTHNPFMINDVDHNPLVTAAVASVSHREVLRDLLIQRVGCPEVGECMSRGVCQPQQALLVEGLSEWHASRLEQLQPTGLVELWLPIGWVCYFPVTNYCCTYEELFSKTR